MAPPRVGIGVKLPAGVERKGRRVIVDASLTLLPVSPGLVLLTRPKRRAVALMQQSDVTGWAGCACSKDGICKIVTKTLPGGSKIEISCEAGTCKGSCSLGAGTWPKSAAFARSLFATVAQTPVVPKK
jgi:hypothetical protein